eukprot:PLAT3533.1.p1 GENE.PLAT3533.1~~PLAT3533.1.p1  ORF type:complete len:1561 (+),score=691.96 PLAT3533.1:1063-5745(+)
MSSSSPPFPPAVLSTASVSSPSASPPRAAPCTGSSTSFASQSLPSAVTRPASLISFSVDAEPMAPPALRVLLLLAACTAPAAAAVTSAVISAGGAVAIVTWTAVSGVDEEVTTRLPCSDVLEAASLTAMGGTQCNAAIQPGQAAVSLLLLAGRAEGAQQAVAAGDSLCFLPSFAAARGLAACTVLSSDGGALVAPMEDSDALAAVQGPTLLGRCSPLILQAVERSLPPAVTVQWSASASTAGLDVTDLLASLSAQRDSATFRHRLLRLDSSLLPIGGDVQFSMTTDDWPSGVPARTSSVTVRRAPSTQLVVSVAGGQRQRIPLGMPLILHGSAYAVGCDGRLLSLTLTYSWAIVAGDGIAAARVPSLAESSLLIPSAAMQSACTQTTLRLTVAATDGSVTAASTTVTVDVTQPPLQLRVLGGDRAFPPSQQWLPLSAQLWPPALLSTAQLTWTCADVTEGSPGSSCALLPSALPSAAAVNVSRLQLTAGALLRTSRHFRFTLTAQLPAGSCASPAAAVAATTTVTLLPLEVTTLAFHTAAHWPLLPSTPLLYTVEASSASLNSSQWTMPSTLRAAALGRSPLAATTALLLPAHGAVVTAGSSFTLRVAAQGAAYATLQQTVRRPPLRGWIAFDSAVAHSADTDGAAAAAGATPLTTAFHLTTDGWVVDSGLLPLRWRFSFGRDGSHQLPLSALSRAAAVDSRLPPGTSLLCVTAADVMAASSRVCRLPNGTRALAQLALPASTTLLAAVQAATDDVLDDLPLLPPMAAIARMLPTLLALNDESAAVADHGWALRLPAAAADCSCSGRGSCAADGMPCTCQQGWAPPTCNLTTLQLLERSAVRQALVVALLHAWQQQPDDRRHELLLPASAAMLITAVPWQLTEWTLTAVPDLVALLTAEQGDDSQPPLLDAPVVQALTTALGSITPLVDVSAQLQALTSASPVAALSGLTVDTGGRLQSRTTLLSPPLAATPQQLLCDDGQGFSFTPSGQRGSGRTAAVMAVASCTLQAGLGAHSALSANLSSPTVSLSLRHVGGGVQADGSALPAGVNASVLLRASSTRLSGDSAAGMVRRCRRFDGAAAAWTPVGASTDSLPVEVDAASALFACPADATGRYALIACPAMPAVERLLSEEVERSAARLFAGDQTTIALSLSAFQPQSALVWASLQMPETLQLVKAGPLQWTADNWNGTVHQLVIQQSNVSAPASRLDSIAVTLYIRDWCGQDVVHSRVQLDVAFLGSVITPLQSAIWMSMVLTVTCIVCSAAAFVVWRSRKSSNADVEFVVKRSFVKFEVLSDLPPCLLAFHPDQREFAEELLVQLHNRDFPAQVCLLKGMPTSAAHALLSSGLCYLFLVSPQSVSNTRLVQELFEAHRAKLPIIPIYVQDCAAELAVAKDAAAMLSAQDGVVFTQRSFRQGLNSLLLLLRPQRALFDEGVPIRRVLIIHHGSSAARTVVSTLTRADYHVTECNLAKTAMDLIALHDAQLVISLRGKGTLTKASWVEGMHTVVTTTKPVIDVMLQRPERIPSEVRRMLRGLQRLDGVDHPLQSTVVQLQDMIAEMRVR